MGTCKECGYWQRRGRGVGVCTKLKIEESGTNAFGPFLAIKTGEYLYPSNTLTTDDFGCTNFVEKAKPFFTYPSRKGIIVAHRIGGKVQEIFSSKDSEYAKEGAEILNRLFEEHTAEQ